MKTSHDPRHVLRREAVKILFAESYTRQPIVPELVQEILKKKTEVDKHIEVAAPAWPLDKLNRVDLAVLRLATYELFYTNTPPKVIIDEAVELSKEFGSEASPSFVNGVLGTVYKKEEKEGEKDEQTN